MRPTIVAAIVLGLNCSAVLAAEPTRLASFAEQAAPPAPDYARPKSWAARPGREGAAGAVRPGASAPLRATSADVFYVRPTTYRSTANRNQDIADASANAWTDVSVITRRASAFNTCCRIFAPHYRQASTRSFTAMAGDGGKALALAYSDVDRAFDRYLRHDTRGRPFILAGDSQGAYHIAPSLEERIDRDPALRRRMVAAYVIGFNLSEGDFGKTYRHVRPCAAPAQTGCVAMERGAGRTRSGQDASRWRTRYVAKYGDDRGKTLLCIDQSMF